MEISRRCWGAGTSPPCRKLSISALKRIQSREYLLFARYYTDEDGAQRVHWHLSPNTPRLLQRVRDAIGVADPNTNERVIRQQ